VYRQSGEGSCCADKGLRIRMRGEERRISAQHGRLGELFDRVLASLDTGRLHLVLSDFLLFSTAIEAHMVIEEEIYFPALHGLRNDVGTELLSLMEEHVRIRGELSRVQDCLNEENEVELRRTLDVLASLVDRHEKREEDLFARISEGPLSRFGHADFEDEC